MIVITSLDKLPDACDGCPCYNKNLYVCQAGADEPNEPGPPPEDCPLINWEVASQETCIYDECEEIPNCTVQILHNTFTDEYSVGWWRQEEE